MSNDKWNEDDIEKRLRDMHTVEDRRSKDEVLQRLKNDSRLSELKQPKKRPSKSKWPPVIATVAAILLLTIFTQTFLQQNDEVSMDKAITEESAGTVDIEAGEEQQSTSEADMSTLTKQAPAPLYYAAYSADVVDHTALHIGLATDQATIIPVTFLVPNEGIPEGLGTSPDAVALYNEYANTIDEQSLGFTEYHPYKAVISSVGKKVQMKFTADHSYDTASATLEMLNLSIQDTFYDFDEVELLQQDGSPILFDQVGVVKDPVALAGAVSHQPYYQFVKVDGEVVLSTNFGKTSETVEQALEEMKTTPNDVYSTVIPEAVDFTVTDEEDAIKVQFTDKLDLDTLEVEEAMQLIEGILLTAASFDKQVQFDGIVQQQWNQFDFTQPLEKPIGANPKFLINQ